jgi:hypothetical protein
MRTEKEERIDKLCSGFSLLDEKDQEYIFGVLQALLFAKKKKVIYDFSYITDKERKGEKKK